MSEQFDNEVILSENTFSPQLIKKNMKKRKIKKFFNTLKNNLLPEEIDFKVFRINLKKFKTNAFFAWEIFTLLTTSVLTNKIPDDEGNFKLVLDSIYNIFKEITNNMKKYYGAKITTIIALELINKEIRPFLGKWHSKYLNENFAEINNEFKNDLLKLQENIINNYLEKFSELSTLYHEKSQFLKYLNG